MNASFIPIFETKSNRVKGVSFHPTRPWILAALHNGSVQLWDYRIKTLLDRFEEHDGPVRGVCFHPNQPLFVSGGDDYKIKVWNYKERRCLFTLLGHLDYIRTVEFHHEYPWILSASDDQTIRIWNWQSRTCITVLTGHSHYVMCAKFHPTEDLVVSASLDSTVRVWDIGGLRKKNVIPQHESDGMKLQNELFGNTDAIVKYVLEGHDRGVNWAAFHPTLPLIISGADDRQIKLWRMSETKAWEVDTMRGHYNNVSCCIFHPKLDLMVSDGEDKTIRVWDMSKRSLLLTHRREHDRFWILTSHPQRNLFAAGHDSGFVIFKLEKERPAMTVVPGEAVFYIKDRYIRAYEFATGRDVPVLTLRKRDAAPRNIQYNKAEQSLIVNFVESDNQGFYELYSLPKTRNGTAVESQTDNNKRGSGKSAVWFSRNKFAVLDKHGSVHLRDGQGSDVKLETSYAVDAIFTAPSGQLLLKVDDRAILYDVARKTEVAETCIPSGVKFVEWSGYDTNSFISFISKDTVVITNAKLEVLSTIAERTRIKSGVWDDSGIFIYCTMGHIKYSLPGGDHGIVRTLDQPIYLTAVKGNKIYCLDRECRNRGVTIDTTEYMFKQALVQKRFGEVLKMVRGANLVGQSIIGYLQQKGFPEVALHFVKDERTRFELALECGNIDIARESAEILGDSDAFRKLGHEALRQGHQEWVEESYMRTNDFDRLTFLYTITGNTKNLKRMGALAAKRKDIHSRFHNALLVGDAAERVKILEETGQLPLAYLTAKTHGLNEEAARLYEKINSRNHDQKVQQLIQSQNLSEPPEVPIEDVAAKIRGVEKPRLLLPPIPVVRDGGNWPHLTVSRGPFDAPTAGTPAAQKLHAASTAAIAAAELGDEEESGWGEDEDVGAKKGADQSEDTEAPSTEEEGAWDDLELPDVPKPAKKVAAAQQIQLPREGPAWPSLWCVNSDLPADHVAAGSFETAMQLLNQQIGATNFAPMKQHFMRVYQGARARLIAQPGTASLDMYLLRNPEAASSRDGLPQLAISVSELIEKVQLGYRATTAGRFQEAVEAFKSVFAALPLVSVNSSQELSEVREVLSVCTDYVLGIQTELKRKDLLTQKGDAVRIAELAAYFTHVNLQPIHLQLTLRSAMNICIKLKNFATAYNFGRRLLDLSSNKPDVIEKTQQAMDLCVQSGLQDEIRLSYDERNPFVICGASYTPIYRGTQSSNCSYCPAQFKPEYNGQQCTVCGIGRVGVRGSGLVVIRSRKPAPGGPRSRPQPAQPQQQDDDFDF